MIKVLYLSNSLSEIKSANYQYEIYRELKNHYNISLVEVNKYSSKKIKEILISKIKNFELIIVGHSFLGDKEGEISKHHNINLSDFKKPIIFFLNKEYVNLNNKLNWIKKNKPALVLTHSLKFYHKYKSYKNSYKISYLPFAADHNLFTCNSLINKDIDLSFSGILKNSNKNSNQSDYRVKIMNELFFTFSDIPLIKKKSYKEFKIFWNSIPQNKYIYHLSRIFGKYKFLDIKKYALIQKRSKSFLNTISPYGIISPRYYENLFSKSLIFSEESRYLEEANLKNLVITFKNIYDFREKFLFYLNNKNQRNQIIEKSFKEGNKLHTWEKRINYLEKLINKSI